MLELRQTCGMRAMDERDGFDELDQGGEIVEIIQTNEIDALIPGIDSWEELMALPWEVQQELERRYPEVVRRLELGFVKEIRFPVRD